MARRDSPKDETPGPGTARQDALKREAETLWLALYDEAPVVEADGSLLLQALIQSTKLPAYVLTGSRLRV